MVPWRFGSRMLEEVEASGSGSPADKTWAEEVAEHLPPDTPEEYAVAGGVLVVAVLACVVHRNLFAVACWHAVASSGCCCCCAPPPLLRGQCCAVPEITGFVVRTRVCSPAGLCCWPWS